MSSRESVLRKFHGGATTYVPIGDAMVPWRFESVEREYRALRETAGLMDLSGLGYIYVSGHDSSTLLQEELTKDIGFMMPERSVTGLLLTDAGSPVDLVVVYKVEGGYVVETSLGQGSVTIDRFKEAIADRSLSAEVADLTSSRLIIGVEGPDAWRCSKEAVGVEVSGLPFEGVMHASWGGSEVMISRTGYTSEFGFKVFTPHEVAGELWKACANVAIPTGFEALEVTMLEVRQPRLHREIEDGATVVECGLNWLVDLEKEAFVGRGAVLAEASEGANRTTIGFAASADSSVTPGATLLVGDREVGHVVDVLADLGLDAYLGLASVDPAFAASGLSLELDCGSGREEINTLSSPYRVPTSWSAIRRS